jgi:hypothetical protein
MKDIRLLPFFFFYFSISEPMKKVHLLDGLFRSPGSTLIIVDDFVILGRSLLFELAYPMLLALSVGGLDGSRTAATNPISIVMDGSFKR